MKLSDKGKNRINAVIDMAFEEHPDNTRDMRDVIKEYLTDCNYFEFEPDDFKDVAVLSTKDAIAFKNCITRLLLSKELEETDETNL